MKSMMFPAVLLLAGMFCLGGCQTTGCIVSGQTIRCPGGDRRIDDLRIGDEVTARDESGVAGAGRVTAIRRSQAASYLRLTFQDGTAIEVTEEHPIAARGGWIRAGDLIASSRVSSSDGEMVIEKIERVDAPAVVFDLSVEPQQTYFVGDVLVHNKSIMEPLTLGQLAGTWVGSTTRVPAKIGYRMDIDEAGFITLTVREGSWRSQTPISNISYNAEKAFQMRSAERGPGELRLTLGAAAMNGHVFGRYYDDEVVFTKHSAAEEFVRATQSQVDQIPPR